MMNQCEVVVHFKYHDLLKSADGNGNTLLLHIRSRIGMAKEIMLYLVQIWRDRGINKVMKIELLL